MFQPGKTYKVKVELDSGEVGFGRITVVSKEGSKLLVQLATSRQANEVLPKGARLSFVSDSLNNPFNGLWTTTVAGARIHAGKTIMECGNPKFHALAQQRKSQRLPLNCPVDVQTVLGQEISYEIRASNISKSGIGLEAQQQDVHEFEIDQHVNIVVHSQIGDIAITCRVVRCQYNWIANRTTIGLEFVQMNEQSADVLTALLERLKPRSENADMNDKGLVNWVKSTRDNMRFVQPADNPNTTPGKNDSGVD